MKYKLNLVAAYNLAKLTANFPCQPILFCQGQARTLYEDELPMSTRIVGNDLGMQVAET